MSDFSSEHEIHFCGKHGCATDKGFCWMCAEDQGQYKFIWQNGELVQIRTKESILAEIESIKGSNSILYFSTNPEFPRGTVFQCRMDRFGIAVAFGMYRWDGARCSRTRPTYLVLGTVTPKFTNDGWTMMAGNYQLKR